MAAAKKREAEPVAEPSYFDEDDEDDDVELDLVWGTEDDEEPGEGDEEIFNFETGWNLEALGVDVDGDDEEDDSEQVRAISPTPTLGPSLLSIYMAVLGSLPPRDRALE
jgi:hypothetical protein